MTCKVETVNAAVVAPGRTFTVPGTLPAAELELLRVTTIPTEGAAPVSVTVPVTVV